MDIKALKKHIQFYSISNETELLASLNDEDKLQINSTKILMIV